MKLENIFTLDDYHQCVEKFNQNQIFEKEYKSKDKKLKFSIGLCSCHNGVWKDNMYRFYDMLYKTGGYSHPFGTDEEIPTYEQLCQEVNERIEKKDRK